LPESGVAPANSDCDFREDFLDCLLTAGCAHQQPAGEVLDRNPALSGTRRRNLLHDHNEIPAGAVTGVGRRYRAHPDRLAGARAVALF
jgi:hypothetical protein